MIQLLKFIIKVIFKKMEDSEKITVLLASLSIMMLVGAFGSEGYENSMRCLCSAMGLMIMMVLSVNNKKR